ncbi:MAG: tetratricopeptide repeat protein [Bacteroidales bacterium]|nr:tetratricopeptide repeat protein [Bacteroidales bacterium]
MKTKDKISNNNEGCVGSDMLLKYVKGELSGQERNWVERHLSTCEMCSDELEGLSLLDDHNKVDSIANELNDRIDKVVEGNDKVIPAWSFYFRIAASITLILGISTIVYFTAIRKAPSTMISDNVVSEKAKPSTPQNAEKFEAPKEIEKIKRMEKQEFVQSEASKRSKKSIKSEEEQKESEISYVAPVVVDSLKEVIVDEKVADDVKLATTDSLLPTSESIVTGQVTAEAYSPAKSENVERKKLSSNKEVSMMDAASGVAASREFSEIETYNFKKESAINLYLKGKYQNALSIFRGLNNDFPDNDTIQFYTSMSYYHLNRTERAISIFEKLISQRQSIFYNEAKWYYALSLIKYNNTDKAIVILNEIVSSESSFKDLAKEELKKLNGNK